MDLISCVVNTGSILCVYDIRFLPSLFVCILNFDVEKNNHFGNFSFLTLAKEVA